MRTLYSEIQFRSAIAIDESEWPLERVTGRNCDQFRQVHREVNSRVVSAYCTMRPVVSRRVLRSRGHSDSSGREQQELLAESGGERARTRLDSHLAQVARDAPPLSARTRSASTRSLRAARDSTTATRVKAVCSKLGAAGPRWPPTSPHVAAAGADRTIKFPAPQRKKSPGGQWGAHRRGARTERIGLIFHPIHRA